MIRTSSPRPNRRHISRHICRRRVAIAAAASLAAGYVNIAQATTFNATWGNFATGNYGTASNWLTSGGNVPNDNSISGEYFNVTINRAPGTVVTGNVSAEIMNLTIGAGNALNLNNTVNFSLIGTALFGSATFNNGGTLTLNTVSGNGSDLNFDATSTNITGAGTIIMTAGSTIAGAGTVTTNNLITGSGSIGFNNMAIVNNGTISSDDASQTLFIDPRSSGGLVNNNIMRATGSSTLILSGNGGGIFTNTGTISASGTNGISQAAVNLVDGATVSGGTITTNAFGRVQVPTGHTATLSGVTSIGNVQVNNGATLSLAGTITNNDDIVMTGSSSAATINVGAGTVTLNGTGRITLGNASINGNITGSGTLVNNATIQGRGQIGFGALVIRNNGLIDQNTSSPMTFAPEAIEIGVFNTGTIRASAGIMHFNSVVMSNTGTIGILSGATLSADGPDNDLSITGGTINVASGAAFSLLSTTSSHALRDVIVNNSGHVQFANGSNYVLDNCTFNNAGGIDFGGAPFLDSIGVGFGTVTFTGGGTIHLAATGTVLLHGVGTLTNLDNTISGTGRVGSGQLPIVNTGTFSAGDNDDRLTIGLGPADMTNTGTLAATSTGILTLDNDGNGAVNNNGGTISATNGGIVELKNGLVVSGGSLRSDNASIVRVNGSFASLSDVTNLGNFGVANGTATIGNTITNSGTIAVVLDSNPATLSIGSGSVTLVGDGTVNLGAVSGGAPTLTGTGTLISNNLIHGRGNFGTDSMMIRNFGTISADQSSQSMVLDPGSRGIINFGTLQAANGGHLVLTGNGGGSFNNTGTIQAVGPAVSLVRLVNGVAISGGTISSVGANAAVQVDPNQTATLNNVANTGALLVQSGAVLNVGTNITNAGQLNLAAGALGASMNLTGGTFTLNGSGVLNMLSSGAGVAAILGSGTLVNGSTIRGRGSVGANVIGVVNNGTISANASGGGELAIDPGALGAAAMQNNGQLEATNGGLLRLTGNAGGGITQGPAGLITALDASSVRLTDGIQITGGTISSSGTGSIVILQNQNPRLVDLTLAGNVNSTSSLISLGGTVTNTGTINATAANPSVTMALDDFAVLENVGTMNLSNGVQPLIFTHGTVNNSGMIQGTAQIGLSLVGTQVNNTGTVSVQNGTMVLNAGTLANGGTLLVTSSSTFSTSGPLAHFNNANGTVLVHPSATFLNSATMSSSAANTGSVIVNGQFINGGTASLGPVTGSGSFLGGNLGAGSFGRATVTHLRLPFVDAAGGTITVRAGGGTVGTSRITTLDQPDGGRVDLTDHDLIIDYTTTTPIEATRLQLLNGRLNISGLLSSNANTSGGRNALGYAEASQIFGPSGGTFSGQAVDGTTVLVKYTWSGDADLNGRVNFDDYVRTDNGFNNHLPGWINGDFDYNGGVNFDDYVLIDLAFNTQTGTLRRALRFADGSDRSLEGMDAPALQMVRQHAARFGEPYLQHLVATVPEPGVAVGSVGIGLGAMLRRRRGH